jgi:RNA polymerase sigma-70 factor (ECF subfamily)
MSVRASASLAAIEREYRDHFAAFLRVAAAIAGEDAGRDAVQEAFVAAVKGRRKYRGDAPLEAWLWRIVVNSARKQATRRNTDIADLERPDVAVDDAVDTSGIRAEIGHLPERQRYVLFLRYFADLDYASIAAVLDMAPGTVGATLHAAHDALRPRVEVERR